MINFDNIKYAIIIFIAFNMFLLLSTTLNMIGIRKATRLNEQHTAKILKQLSEAEKTVYTIDSFRIVNSAEANALINDFRKTQKTFDEQIKQILK